MQKKLSTKERKETVTKGFLKDQDYITKVYFHDTLEEILDSKNYVTKEWAQNMFETFEKRIDSKIEESFGRHIRATIEHSDEKFNILVELFNARFERIERYIG